MARRSPSGASLTWRLLAVMSLVAGALALGNTGASASTTLDQIFQLDGNGQDDAVAVAPDDWQTLMSPNTPAAAGFVASSAVPVHDGKSPVDGTYYAGGGSKDVNDINQWAWTTGDVAPDKDELLNAAAAGYKIANSTGGKDLIVFFTADRFDNSGDSQIGFWFFGNDVKKNASNGFDSTHKVGDILVLSDFSQGGTVSTINVYEWIGGKQPLQHLTQGSGSVDCSDAAHNPFVCAIENHNDGTPSVWPFQSKTAGANLYPHGTFIEGGINVTKLLGGSSACFASFLAETRSSTSTTAQLKDFALGSFPVCAPKTSLSISQSPTGDHHTGDSVTLTYSDTNLGTGPLTSPTVADDNCSPVAQVKSGGYNTGDANTNNLLDVGETWAWSCTTTAAAATATHTAIAHGTDANFGNVDVTWCADPSNPSGGVYCSQGEKAQLTLTLINPSTTLTVTSSASTVHSGDSVTFTYKEANDGDGPITGSPYPIAVSDDSCTSVTYLSGDTGSDGVLSVGETWTFTCTKQVTATETHHALGSGTDSAGARLSYVNSGSCSNTATFHCDPSEAASATVTVVNPGTQLTISASATVTYTFFEENKGDVPLTSVSVDTSGAGCTTPATAVLVSGFNFGDANQNNKLDVGEKWKFTCTGSALTWSTGQASATQTNTGTGHGKDNTDVVSGGADVTWGTGCISTASKVCDSREQSGVTVTISGS